MNKIVVVVNKKWEAAPILGVLRAPYAVVSHASARPFEWSPGRPYPVPQMWPDASAKCNFEYRYTLAAGACRIEFWCLADFEDTSDSGRKSAYIPQIVASGQPDLVIAAGTAAAVAPNLQGSVMVGCRTFMHDPKVNQAPPQPEWPASFLDRMLESTFAAPFAKVLAALPTAWPIEVRRRLLPGVDRSSESQIRMDPVFVSLADVNVLDYTKYKATDPQTVDACSQADPHARIASLDTTLALIRAKTDPAAFLFVSGVANQMGFYNRDVTDTEYPSNLVASHNIGVVLAWLLPVLAGL